MIKQIITNEKKLSRQVDFDIDPTNEAILDLRDTALHYAGKRSGCAGLAANQIGHMVPAIVIWYGNEYLVMIRPIITVKSGGADFKREGCLSRPGKTPRIRRHKRVKVDYFNEDGVLIMGARFTGFTARVIQHEVDHLHGIYIP